MSDSTYGVPDSARGRFVRRLPNLPGGVLNDPDLIQRLGAASGMCTTAYDLATFGQMFLNRGRYGRSRIVSAASIAEMTRNQTPGISASLEGQHFPESSWGLGWDVHGMKRGLRSATLVSPNAISHGGAGGTYTWIDSDSDMVGVYLSVNRVGSTEQEHSPFWRADLFVNAATAAIDEP
jgi:serine-type D-Ala-D-Ala carboxypeptidase